MIEAKIIKDGEQPCGGVKAGLSTAANELDIIQKQNVFGGFGHEGIFRQNLLQVRLWSQVPQWFSLETFCPDLGKPWNRGGLAMGILIMIRYCFEDNHIGSMGHH
jgi:hypothetical protein